MKQILSHYQALPAPSEAFNPDAVIDIDTIMDLVVNNLPHTDEEIEEFNKNFQFFIGDHEEMFHIEVEPNIGRISFSREASLFPTLNPEECGVIISLRGKEYCVYYDDEGRLTIGHNNNLYCFGSSNSWIEDCQEFYTFVVEGIIPEIEVEVTLEG